MKTRYIFSLLMALAIWPLASYAVTYSAPDDSMLKVSVGDEAPLITPDLAKAHAEGKAIILMFGSPDNNTASERTWMNLKFIAPKFDKTAAAVDIDYRGEDYGRPSAEAAEVGRQYGVIGEPWVFVIDKAGVVTHVFSGPTGVKELETELARVATR